MSVKINKNGKEYPLGFMPEHYPADRVYLDGDTDKSVESALIRFATVTGTTASGEYEVTHAYPTGYSQNNCTVVGIMVQIINGRWDFDGESFQAFLNESTVGIVVKKPAYQSRPYKIVLAKI